MLNEFSPVRDVPDGEEREAHAVAAVEQRLRSGHLHRLDIRHHLRLRVTRQSDRRSTGDAEHRADSGCGPEHRDLMVAREMPQTDPKQQRARGEQGGEDGVREGDEEHGVREHGADVVQLRPAGGRVEDVSDGVLHPGVGGEDERCGQPAAAGHQPYRHEMEARREAIPAEYPHAEERRLEEEGEQCLHRQRRAEDVADVRGVHRPVHAELELLHDAGHHAHRDVDHEDPPPEHGHAPPRRVLGAHVDGLHRRDEDREAERQRDEDVVIQRGDAELPAVDVGRAHRPIPSGPPHAIHRRTPPWGLR